MAHNNSISQYGSHMSGQYTISPGGKLHQGNTLKYYNTTNKCLVDLFVTDPRHDKERIMGDNGGLAKGTYNWVLENSDFCQWRDYTDKRLLWVTGEPGKGKTMLLCGIIESLEKEMSPENVFYFFCQATDSRINNAVSVLRGLIYLIVARIPSFLKYVQKEYDQTGRALFEDTNAWFALSKIVRNMLQDSRLQGTYFIIDGLDECLKDQSRLLDLVTQASESADAKWLMSSRNDPAIQERSQPLEREISLERNEKFVSRAVEMYISIRVGEIARTKRLKQNIVTEVHAHLLSNAGGTFLWVALVCYELEKTPSRNTVRKVKSYPRGLDMVFKHMMYSIDGSDDAELCKRILALMATTFRPISLLELPTLMDESEDLENDVATWEEIILSCGSFLKIHNGMIDFIHHSAKEFLVKEESHSLYPLGQIQMHHQLFSRSVEAMSRLLTKDIYQRGTPDSLNDFDGHKKNISPLASGPLAKIAYSCVHWLDHLFNSLSQRNVDVLDKNYETAVSFLKYHCLSWFESLGWLRSVSHVVLSLDSLITFTREATPNSSWPLDMIDEVLSFARSNQWVMENFPLQTYISALVFTPDQSNFRGLFKAKSPPWIRTIHRDSQEWPQTLEGHEDTINRLVFLNNTQMLASASKDNTVRLWDGFTGTPIEVLKHQDEIHDVASWKEGQWLASASADKKIRIWNLSKVKCEVELQGHKGAVKSLAVAADGRWLVSGSSDKTVMVWNLDTGKMERELPHPSAVRHVAISRDGDYVVSATLEKAVRIWSVKDGYSVRKVDLGSNCDALAFSLETFTFASALQNGTIRLVDAGTGECSRVIQSSSSCLGFSCGDLLASGSLDKTMRLWDVASGYEQSRDSSNQHAVTKLGISSDGKILASTSQDNMIRLRTKLTDRQKSPNCHEGRVHQIRISPNGEWLATASADATVHLWCLSTQSLRHILDGHGSDIYSISFSSDSQRLVTGSKDKTARIYNVEEGTCEQCLETDGSEVLGVVFSSDDQRVAIGSQDEKVRIFDVENGHCEHVLWGHQGRIHEVSYSKGNEFIMCASKDGTPSIWSPRTGNLLRGGSAESKQPELLSPGQKALLSHTNHDSSAAVLLAPSPATQEAAEGELVLREMSIAHTKPSPGLYVQDNWVCKDGQRWLWLPPDDRPSCWHSSGDLLAFGHDSRDITVLQFDFQKY